jgi:hypothetical protein
MKLMRRMRVEMVLMVVVMINDVVGRLSWKGLLLMGSTITISLGRRN